MANREMPQISSAMYSSNTVTGDAAIGWVDNTAGQSWREFTSPPPSRTYHDDITKILRQQGAVEYLDDDEDEDEDMADAKARLVRVLIVDPDENVPLSNRILYSGEEQFTDLSDQELFFEIEIKKLLDDHNEYRKTVDDKEASKDRGKTVMLEPIRIRDLKMTVVTIAQF